MSAEHALRIGKVVEVSGSTVRGELEANVGDLYRTYKSRKYAIGQIGSTVKIAVGDSLVFGLVTCLRMEENESLQGPSNSSMIWLDIELLGQGTRHGLGDKDFVFERGVIEYPLPGQAIYLASEQELTVVYAAKQGSSFQVGRLSQARLLPACLMADMLLGRHFAVLGTTGSGKSCAVTLILRALISNYKEAHIIVLDPHNEYSTAFGDQSNYIDPTKLTIPHWLMNFEESTEMFIGKTEFVATSQTNILKDGILAARKKFNSGMSDLTVDTPVPYKLGDLVASISSSKPITKTESAPYDKILAKLETLTSDKRFEFMLQPDASVKDNLMELLVNWLRFPTNSKPISIIDLSGVPSDVIDVVVSMLCRIVFDFSLWNASRSLMPILLICEEAHRYVPRKDEASFKPTKRAVSRLAKEGRKYGVSLGLVSQRPSDLDEGILSQCNTVIALRMTNQEDHSFVRRCLPDAVRGLVDSLPALRTREAVVVGEGTPLPVRFMFDELPEQSRPRSADVAFSAAWQDGADRSEAVTRAIENWRSQTRS